MTNAETFNKKARLDAVFNRQAVDRPPALGGWIADPEKIMALTETTEDDYWKDPIEVSVRAYKMFDLLDGLIDIFVPLERGGYRNITKNQFDERAQKYTSPEDVVAEIERLPSPEQVKAEFDYQAFYDEAVAKMRTMQGLCGEYLYWCPTRWEVVPRWEWYQDFGYDNYFMAIRLYPDKVGRLLEYAAALAECKGQVIIRMIKEGIQPRCFLCGKDICGQRGPMVDPGFLRERWFPLVRKAFTPLREAGAHIVWHCDGYVMPVLEDILGLGVAGLQGFQTETGFRLEDIVERRALDGQKLLLFGPVSVTTTLVKETPAGVKKAVREAVNICRDKVHLVLMTANVIGPDIPLENVFAMYEALKEE